MKNLKQLFAVLVLLLAMTIQAQNTETKISEERIEDISNKICHAALAYRTLSGKEAGKDIEDLILANLGTSREDPNHQAILTKFWNEHNEKLICYEGPEDETRNPQHFLKRIVDLGMYKSVLYDFLLSDPEGYPIDVNPIEIYNGKEETLLDYIDYILNKPNASSEYNVKEIQSLRSWLVMGYNAKTASQLKN